MLAKGCPVGRLTVASCARSRAQRVSVAPGSSDAGAPRPANLRSPLEHPRRSSRLRQVLLPAARHVLVSERRCSAKSNSYHFCAHAEERGHEQLGCHAGWSGTRARVAPRRAGKCLRCTSNGAACVPRRRVDRGVVLVRAGAVHECKQRACHPGAVLQGFTVPARASGQPGSPGRGEGRSRTSVAGAGDASCLPSRDSAALMLSTVAHASSASTPSAPLLALLSTLGASVPSSPAWTSLPCASPVAAVADRDDCCCCCCGHRRRALAPRRCAARHSARRARRRQPRAKCV